MVSVKQLYDQEIDSLKSAFHNLSQQYNQLRVASDGLMYENEEMKGNIARKEVSKQGSR